MEAYFWKKTYYFPISEEDTKKCMFEFYFHKNSGGKFITVEWYRFACLFDKEIPSKQQKQLNSFLKSYEFLKDIDAKYTLDTFRYGLVVGNVTKKQTFSSSFESQLEEAYVALSEISIGKSTHLDEEIHSFIVTKLLNNENVLRKEPLAKQAIIYALFQLYVDQTYQDTVYLYLSYLYNELFQKPTSPWNEYYLIQLWFLYKKMEWKREKYQTAAKRIERDAIKLLGYQPPLLLKEEEEEEEEIPTFKYVYVRRLTLTDKQKKDYAIYLPFFKRTLWSYHIETKAEEEKIPPFQNDKLKSILIGTKYGQTKFEGHLEIQQANTWETLLASVLINPWIKVKPTKKEVNNVVDFWCKAMIAQIKQKKI